MYTLLFTTLLTISQSSRLLLQNVPFPIPTAGNNGNGNGNGIGNANNNGAAATELECLLMNTDPAGCAGKITRLTNPPLNFKVKCGGQGSCASSQFYFEYTSNVERIEQLLFSAQYAGYGATVTVDSCGNAMGQSIDVLECSELGSCNDLTIKLLCGASINDIKCDTQENCQGCMIKDCINNNGIEVCGVPIPCWGF